MDDIATVNAYYNADKSNVVGEGDPAAAYVLALEGSPLTGLSEQERKDYDQFARRDTIGHIAKAKAINPGANKDR